jgi:predicted RNase H-like HicB family nuclease
MIRIVTRSESVPSRQCAALEYPRAAMKIELEQEEDGRWIAEVPDISGAMIYGQTRDEAISRVKALALRVLADRLEHGENIPELRQVFEIAA